MKRGKRRVWTADEKWMVCSSANRRFIVQVLLPSEKSHAPHIKAVEFADGRRNEEKTPGLRYRWEKANDPG